MLKFRKENKLDLNKDVVLLLNLPKNCVCTTCTSIRNDFKSKYGEKKYKEVVNYKEVA